MRRSPAAAAPSVHDQTLALMLGLAPAAHPAMPNRYLLPYLRDEPVPGANPSAFWSAYVLAEAGRRGHAAECIGFIRSQRRPDRRGSKQTPQTRPLPQAEVVLGSRSMGQ